MPIVGLKPDAQPPIKVTTPETIEAPSESIFTSLVPESKITSLLKYIEGYPWTIDYYGQLLNKNNTLENFDPTTPNLTQPYYKVNKLVLQVSSPLSASYTQETGITVILGSAIMPYGIIPNAGDVFIAQVDSGEDAIFHITTVSRKTHRKHSVYEISYSLYSYTSTNPDFITTLASRVNDEYYFDDNNLTSNRDILIKPSVKEANDRLKHFLNESQDYYFRTFCQEKNGTILIPGINYSVYDPLLIEFIGKIVPYDKLVEINFYKHAYVSKYINQPSILEAILNRSMSTLKIANKTFNFLSSASIQNIARLGTAFHAGIDYILHPTNPDRRTDLEDTVLFNRSEYLTTMKTSKNSIGDIPITIKTANNNDVFIKEVTHELFLNDYYIVSENFYNYLDDNTKYELISFIELLLAKFLNKEAIAKEDLAVAVEEYSSWSLLHQMYLLPVMWVLVKYTL